MTANDVRETFELWESSRLTPYSFEQVAPNEYRMSHGRKTFSLSIPPAADVDRAWLLITFDEILEAGKKR